MVEDYNYYEPGAFSRDCIAIVRSLVNAVSNITFFFNFIATKKKSRFVTAISKNSNFWNMFNYILSKTISYFVMYPQDGLQHY